MCPWCLRKLIFSKCKIQLWMTFLVFDGFVTLFADFSPQHFFFFTTTHWNDKLVTFCSPTRWESPLYLTATWKWFESCILSCVVQATVTITALRLFLIHSWAHIWQCDISVCWRDSSFPYSGFPGSFGRRYSHCAFLFFIQWLHSQHGNQKLTMGVELWENKNNIIKIWKWSWICRCSTATLCSSAHEG